MQTDHVVLFFLFVGLACGFLWYRSNADFSALTPPITAEAEAAPTAAPVIAPTRIIVNPITSSRASQRDDARGIDYAGRRCEVFRADEIDAEARFNRHADGYSVYDENGEGLTVPDYYVFPDVNRNFHYVSNCPWLYPGLMMTGLEARRVREAAWANTTWSIDLVMVEED